MGSEIVTPSTLVDNDTLTEHQKRQQKNFLRGKGVDISKPVQLSLILPMHREFKRMQPNDTVRSALFTARNDNVERIQLKRHTVFSPDATIKMTYSGEELRASSDELIWMQVLEYAKDVPIGEFITISIRQICADIGWSPNPKYYEIVRASLERLGQGQLKIVSERHGKAVYMPMIILHESDEKISNEATKFIFSIHSDLILLVAGKTVTHLEMPILKKLTAIQQRLYGYVSSHAQPNKLYLMDFHKMCSSKDMNKSSFKQNTKKAVNKLVELGLLKNGWIDRQDFIHFER